MTETFDRDGYRFHGGCADCTQPLYVCPTCCYMEADWSLPNRNNVANARGESRRQMVEKALAARALYVRERLDE